MAGRREGARRTRRAFLAAGAFALVIFATAPAATFLREMLLDRFGRGVFTALVIACGLVATGFAGRALWRARRMSVARLAWLAGVTTVFVAATAALRHAPEEAIHFVEYGALGLLLHRAFALAYDEKSAIPAAFCAGVGVGALDEAIQWALPDRYWNLRDVGLDAAALVLALAGVAGVRPLRETGPSSRRGLLVASRLAIVVLLLVGASLANTPARITWYAERIPGLGFLLENESVMAEYGHLYEYRDGALVRFRSRLAPEELRRTDRERAGTAAPVLDRHREESAYRRFLRIHTPATDPFLHEVRVHLFRRDRYVRTAREAERSDVRREHATVAWRENQILERYFGETLRRSAFVFSPETRSFLEGAYRREEPYTSKVSRDLMTTLGEGEVMAILLVALAALVLVERRLARPHRAA